MPTRSLEEFQQYMEGVVRTYFGHPMTDADRVFESDRFSRGQEPIPEENPLPKPPSEEEVQAYLETQFPNDPHIQNTCTLLRGCNVFEVEAKLLPLLDEAKRANDPERIRKIRALIWASSERTHPPLSKESEKRTAFIHEALAFAYQELSDARKALMQSGDVEEARELSDERLPRLEGIEHALFTFALGNEAEEAVTAIEELLTNVYKSLRWNLAKGGTTDWKHADVHRTPFHTRLEKLRSLRDALYFQRLYPEWFKT